MAERIKEPYWNHEIDFSSRSNLDILRISSFAAGRIGNQVDEGMGHTIWTAFRNLESTSMSFD